MAKDEGKDKNNQAQKPEELSSEDLARLTRSAGAKFRP